MAARRATGDIAAADASLLPWSSLSEYLRESNRAQARHISAKFDAISWRDGPRDSAKKTTPHLVPWAQPDEPTRELDRITVRDLPRFLLDVGYEIVRTSA